MYRLRDYQQAAADAGVRYLTSGGKGNGIIILPTGAGKSLVIAEIASRLDKPLIVFQPSKEILEQNRGKLQSYGIASGVYSASLGSKDIQRITFATIGSVMANIDSFSDFGYILIDECHTVNAEDGMYKRFLSQINARVLGFTATPYRLHSSRDFGSILRFITRTRPKVFTDVVYTVQVADLSNRGYLARLEYYPLKVVDTAQLKVNSVGSDYTDKSVKEHYKRIGFAYQVVGIVRRLLNAGRPSVLVFTRFIEEASYIAHELGEIAAVVSQQSTPSERSHILQGFKSGVFKVVANVGILTTGFDFPALSAVVLARPTMSLSLYYQMVGRAIRPHQDQTKWVVDLCGTYDRFGRVEDLQVLEPQSKLYAVFNGSKQLTNVYYKK